jgi:hypothetical protein
MQYLRMIPSKVLQRCAKAPYLGTETLFHSTSVALQCTLLLLCQAVLGSLLRKFSL